MALAEIPVRLARAFRRAYDQAQGPDAVGPEIRVSPFRPGEVTGEAVALKSLASLLAGRRSAANAQEQRRRLGMSERYRQALTAQIEAKLNPPVQPTRDVTLPGVTGTVKATDKEILSHPGAFRPPTPEKRAHLSPQLAKELGVPYDPATGTAAVADIGPAERATLRKMVENRFNRAQSATQSRFDESMGLRTGAADRAAADRETKQWSQLMKGLDQNEEDIVRDARARGLQYASDWQRRLLDPGTDAVTKAQAAKNLGVPFARDPNTKALMRDPTGRLMFDLSGLPQRVKDYSAKFGETARQRAISLHAADRLYYMQRLHDATGRFTGQGSPNTPQAPDPMEDVKALLQLYGAAQPAPAEADTSFLDEPAR